MYANPKAILRMPPSCRCHPDEQGLVDAVARLVDALEVLRDDEANPELAYQLWAIMHLTRHIEGAITGDLLGPAIPEGYEAATVTIETVLRFTAATVSAAEKVVRLRSEESIADDAEVLCWLLGKARQTLALYS
jgi:hypothetical protein